MSVLTRDAVLPVDKPEGPTSHDIVAAARRVLGERRVGHTGTLDPFATGLLLLCVGRATRLAEFLSGMGDRDIEEAVAGLRGEIVQVPPQYSAKKVGGVAAHRLARRGAEVELQAQRVTVHGIEVTFVKPPDLGLSVHCSSGTYVRALARDLGEALGVGAHLTALRRTAVGGFRVEDALTMDDLSVPERLADGWIEPLDALAHLARVTVDEAGLADLRQGRAVACADSEDGTPVVAACGGELVAVGEVRDGTFRPRKVLAHD
jgi:tRNA pseudouridine55 synthase